MSERSSRPSDGLSYLRTPLSPVIPAPATPSDLQTRGQTRKRGQAVRLIGGTFMGLGLFTCLWAIGTTSVKAEEVDETSGRLLAAGLVVWLGGKLGG